MGMHFMLRIIGWRRWKDYEAQLWHWVEIFSSLIVVETGGLWVMSLLNQRVLQSYIHHELAVPDRPLQLPVCALHLVFSALECELWSPRILVRIPGHGTPSWGSLGQTL